MSDKFTTVRVYEKDKDTLIKRYGGPANEALSKALEENCPHPEESRSYVTASLPMPANSSQRRTVGGFYCGACGKYVFKKVQTGQLEPETG